MFKKVFKVSVIFLILLNIFSLCFLCFNMGQFIQSKQINTVPYQSGRIQIEVLDDLSGKAVDGASVCIIETRHYEKTDKYGKTSYIEVPIIKNSNFDLSLERPYGEFTILVYKDGYADNISFYNLIRPNTTKVGIKIRLRTIINQEDTATTITVNPPDTYWSDALIKLYKKHF